MATVLVDVGNASGFIFPLIAVHLFVFYFGLMADVTPPVGLASYAAAAISGGDPLKTGLQAIWYSLRTGILPIVFLFNHELLLIGIESIWQALLVIITSLIGILVFTAATQRWFINRLSWYEIIAFLIISISFLAPDFVLGKFYPKFNEQKWTMSTQSGPLQVSIESHSYWGFGLFNSGYLNVIEITGPFEQRMRLMFDLKSSIGRNPWEFSHRNAASRWLVKHHADVTIEANEASEAIEEEEAREEGKK